MRTTAKRMLALAMALTLLAAASAYARAIGGKTYTGTVPTTGIRKESGRRVGLRAGGKIVLKVAGNGRTVSVRFTSPYPVLYCFTNKPAKVQTTKSAKISSSGSFSASVAERFEPGPGLASIVQVVSGHFSGHSVSGTIKTQAAECSGSTSFSAHT